MKKVFFAIVLVVCFSASCWGAPLLTADDFIPVIQAPEEQREELSTVQHPEDIKKEVDPETNLTVVKGRTAQDTINAIIDDSMSEGNGTFYTNDGTGFVATGSASYNKTLKNLTALRTSRQSAFGRAFNLAIGNLAREVEQTVVKGHSNSSESASSMIDGNSEQAVTNMSQSSSSSVETEVAAVLGGYVTYRVFDDFENGQVFVTLVSTPKTRGEFKQSANPNFLSAETRNAGLDAVLAEIQTGFVPPVGGRVVTVPSTGEIAVVGFGSSVVMQSKTQMVLNNNRSRARSIAALYADDALCGILTGNKTQMTQKVSRSEQEAINEYEEIQGENPASKYLPYEEAQSEFFATETFSRIVSNAREGTLPPGVIRRAWLDKEGAVAYAVSVYIGSLSDAAAAGAKGVKNPNLKKQLEPEKGKQHTEENLKKKKSEYQDSGEFQQAPSGTIDQVL